MDMSRIHKLTVNRTSTIPSPNSVEHVLDTNVFLDQPSRAVCYGVLGTGNLGSSIVNNLTMMGKKVYIWNRTVKKCEKLVANLDRGAQSKVEICHIPSLVMQRSDIIFNCISDCHGSKAIIERSLAIEFAPDDFMQGKGLVDMSGVDPHGQVEISELVLKRGGKYLEVRIQHRNESNGGGYLFLVGGNKDLYEACDNCFTSLGGTTVYIEAEVGYITKLNLILQLIKSVYLLGITEGFGLLERMVPLNSQSAQRDIMPILCNTPIASDYFMATTFMILRKKFDLVEQSMQNLGKDIKLGLEMSTDVSEPMIMSSLGEQFFKHCQKLGYSEMDPAAVFMRVRH